MRSLTNYLADLQTLVSVWNAPFHLVLPDVVDEVASDHGTLLEAEVRLPALRPGMGDAGCQDRQGQESQGSHL